VLETKICEITLKKKWKSLKQNDRFLYSFALVTRMDFYSASA